MEIYHLRVSYSKYENNILSEVIEKLVVEKTKKILDDKKFFKPLEKKSSMILNINNIFGRLELSDKEIRILFSIFGSLIKKV
jgi:tRNA C32,U32 (ribose-2'-O)-methylase TrmJ